MPDRLVPDGKVPGAFQVNFGDAAQSWVDPARPEDLAFEYTQHIAIVLEATALRAPAEQRIRAVHVGGAGMSMPRWLAWRRPGTAQIVLEPDAELTAAVRRKLPLPPRSGIKVRDIDGRAGIAAMPSDYADVVIVDAFDHDQVPASLAGVGFLADVARVGRGTGLLVLNVTDRAPFDWSKRLVAGVIAGYPHTLVGADPSVHKGRRFGNVVVVGSGARIAADAIRRASGRLPFGYRWVAGQEWASGATAFAEADARPSPPPSGSKLWFH
ncbi:MAG: spermidine synthase [Arachnia sp.]